MNAMKIIASSMLYTSGRPPLEGGAVVVRDGRIIAVGTLDAMKSEYHVPVEEYPGCVIMPGMVNAHTHLELTHFPAWKLRKGLDYAPRTYVDWIIQVIKLRRGLERSELEHSVREGARISLESGTTTVGEILTDLSLLPLYRQLGVSGRVYCEAIGQSAQQSLDRRTAITEALTSFTGDSLFPGISPHAPHTLSGEFLGDLVALSEQHSLPLMIHLAESAEEVEFCFDSSGKIAEQLYPFVGWESYLPAPRHVSPASLLQAAGGLTPRTSAVHCVHVTPSDVACMREHGASIVLCPRSNERLAVGAPPLMLFKSAGIPLAVGTDSLASNDSLSVWDEVRYLYERFPRLFSPDELLAMATVGGARALHLEQDAGTLEPGRLANIQVIEPAGQLDKGRMAASLLETGALRVVYRMGEIVHSL